VKGAGRHGFSGLRLRASRERDTTLSPTAMRGNCSTEDEPGTASYYIARPARGERTSLFDPSASASTWRALACAESARPTSPRYEAGARTSASE
jgi:hypothetical protein